MFKIVEEIKLIRKCKLYKNVLKINKEINLNICEDFKEYISENEKFFKKIFNSIIFVDKEDCEKENVTFQIVSIATRSIYNVKITK